MGNIFSSSESPSAPERRESTDSVNEWSCPICGDNTDEVAYLIPCHHQFCFPCAMRWMLEKPSCALCRTNIKSVLLLPKLQNMEEYLVFKVLNYVEPAAEEPSEQGSVGPEPRAEVGGFPREVWADFFRKHPDHFQPLQSWLRRELMVLFENQWWEVGMREGAIVTILCEEGLQEEVLVQKLQPYLQEHTESFTRRLIRAAVHLWRSEIAQHLAEQEPHAVRREEQSPAASTSQTSSQEATLSRLPGSSSPADSSTEEEAGNAQAALHGGHSSLPSVPAPWQQEEPEESGNGEESPASGGQENCLPRSNQGRKRKTTSTEDAPQPYKMPRSQEEEAGTSQDALHEGNSNPPSVSSTPSEQDEPRHEGGEVEAGLSSAGPDYIGPGGKRRMKRRIHSPEDSPQPCKVPRCHAQEPVSLPPALHEGNSHSSTVSAPSEQEERMEESEEVEASLSSAGPDYIGPGGKRRMKRRIHSPEDSP